MRIAFDATALPRRAGGAGNYVAQLVEGLKRLKTGDSFFVFAKLEDVARLGPWLSGSGFEPVPVRLRTRPQRLAWEQTIMPSLLRRMGIDLLHSPHYTMPLAFTAAARIVTFHDLIFFLYPQYHSLAKTLFFRRMIRWSSRAADHIITDSDATKADAIRLLDLPAALLTTVRLAPAERFRRVTSDEVVQRIRQRYQLAGPFILSVCTLEPRKNLVGAIRALRILRREGLDAALVIAGAKGWQVDPVFQEVSDPQLREHVIFAGYVPDDDLPALYTACDVFLYPSLYEGFGLPALEAMACGAAVVASDRSSLPEVVGDAGLLCNPDDPADIAAKVRTFLTDPAARQRYGACARARAAEFSWEGTARSTYEVYARVDARRQLRSTVSVGDIA